MQEILLLVKWPTCAKCFPKAEQISVGDLEGASIPLMKTVTMTIAVLHLNTG